MSSNKIGIGEIIQIAEMLDRGMSQGKIALELGVSQGAVWYYAKKLKTESISSNDIQKYRWLKKNWKFTGRVINQRYIGTHTEDGTRIVRKGEKGHLRTPYRTDYKFR